METDFAFYIYGAYAVAAVLLSVMLAASLYKLRLHKQRLAQTKASAHDA